MPSTNTQTLAINGGTPIAPDGVKGTPWPPLFDKTADRLKELYYSREWSFNSPLEQAFEQAFARYHGAKHGIFMVNGTVTLQCALSALGIGEGDEVIVPALTWMATAMAVHYVGATPVFVDIEPDTLCLDAEKTRQAITSKTRAIIPVHLYGSMANLDALMKVAREHDLFVVEDCAHMQGGKWRQQGVGSWGDIGSFSFQQSKTLSSGEGGICITNDDRLAERLYLLKHIGYSRNTQQGQAESGPPEGLMCYNYRGTAFQAAILLDQLEALPPLIETYEKSTAILQTQLEGVPGVRIQARGAGASPQGYYGLVFIFDREPARNVPTKRLLEALKAEGLGCYPTYGPVYNHMLYNMPTSAYRIHETCRVAEEAGTRHAATLFHHYLATDEENIETIANIITKVAQGANHLA